jgi:hypothetical protein
MADLPGYSGNGAVKTAQASKDPVFVLCMGRSGSTLLRFVLDAHPDLACPPETSLPALCGQLAVVWSLIERRRCRKCGGMSRPRSRSGGGRDPAHGRPDDRFLPAATGETVVLRQEPGLGPVRRPAGAGLAAGEVPVPVPGIRWM